MTTKAICKSSAAIDPAWVKTYRSNGWEGEAVATMDGLGVKLYSPGGALREAWIVGQREILEFADVPAVVSTGPITVTQTLTGNMPQVGEKPIDWSKFLPTGNLRTGISTLKAGETWAYGTITSQLVFSVIGVGPLGSAIEVLARSAECSWGLGPEGMVSTPSNSTIIRHADGTWAPGYGPDGPVSEPKTSSVMVVAGVGITFVGCTADPFAEWKRLKFNSPRPFEMEVVDAPFEEPETVDQLMSRMPSGWVCDFNSRYETILFKRSPAVALTCVAAGVSSLKCGGAVAVRPYGKYEQKQVMCGVHYRNDEMAISMLAHRVYPHGLNGLPGDPNPYWSPRLAKLPGPPRANSHRTIEHLKPRWATPAYSPPGRWRK